MSIEIAFIIVTSTVRTTKRGKLKEYSSGKERIDVISRCLLNLRRWQNRFDARFALYVYLSNTEELQTLSIPLCKVNQNLQSEAEALQYLLDIIETNKTEYLRRESFLNLISEKSKNSQIYYLDPYGKEMDCEYFSLNDLNLCFILGSQKDLTKEQEKIVEQFSVEKLSLGKKDYLASHVITIACHRLSKSITSG